GRGDPALPDGGTALRAQAAPTGLGPVLQVAAVTALLVDRRQVGELFHTGQVAVVIEAGARLNGTVASAALAVLAAGATGQGVVVDGPLEEADGVLRNVVVDMTVEVDAILGLFFRSLAGHNDVTFLLEVQKPRATEVTGPSAWGSSGVLVASLAA